MCSVVPENKPWLVSSLLFDSPRPGGTIKADVLLFDAADA